MSVHSVHIAQTTCHQDQKPHRIHTHVNVRPLEESGLDWVLPDEPELQ